MPLIRLGLGRFLILIASVLVPCCWVSSAFLHASICGVGLSAWTCPEPLGDFLLHQALVSVSPATAVLLFAVGDDLRHRP